MQSDVLFAPASLAAVSAVVLVARSVSLSLSKRSSRGNDDLKIGILKAGKAVFAWRLLKLMGCLVLLGLSVASTVLQPRAPRDLYAHIAICVTFVSRPHFLEALCLRPAGVHCPSRCPVYVRDVKSAKGSLRSSHYPSVGHHGRVCIP